MNYEQQLERIVRDEIIYNVSMTVHEITSNPVAMEALGMGIDDVMGILSMPDYSEEPDGYLVMEEPDGWMFATKERDEDDNACSEETGFDSKREAIIAAWNDSGEEPPMCEALEHWIVSDWFADKLEAYGEMVCRDFLGVPIWGRTTSGQMISMDYEIQQIARELADS